MLEPGNVVADFAKRRELIRNAILAEGEKLNANTVVDESLLDEVTGLVEYPVALTGKFDRIIFGGSIGSPDPSDEISSEMLLSIEQGRTATSVFRDREQYS